MKIGISKTVVVISALLLSLQVYGEGDTKNEVFRIDVSGTKFVLPVVERWVAEYQKQNPQVTIEVSEKPVEKPAITLVASHADEQEAEATQSVAWLGRYALLPVSNPSNPLLSQAGKGLNKKELKQLLFERDILEEDGYADNRKEKYKANIYSRNGQAGTTKALADHFGVSPNRIKGKKIFGDEIYLLNEIKKDSLGIAFNSLNYVFDTETRQLKNGLSLLPLNLKPQQKEKLYSADMDAVISLLENESVDLLPVEDFGFVIAREEAGNIQLVSFVQWILEKGQEYNHQYGLLKLNEKTLARQQKQVQHVYLSGIR